MNYVHSISQYRDRTKINLSVRNHAKPLQNTNDKTAVGNRRQIMIITLYINNRTGLIHNQHKQNLSHKRCKFTFS